MGHTNRKPNQCWQRTQDISDTAALRPQAMGVGVGEGKLGSQELKLL